MEARVETLVDESVRLRAALSRSRIRMAEQIDELSLALARIPSVDPRVSAESRTSEASVADLGVLQLQAMLWHGELTWGQTLRHHLTAFSHAVGGFVGGPTLQRDLLFAWLAWFLILAFDPDLPHGSNGAAFDALFEVCSAFGNVGLSMGYSRDTELENVRPGTPQTFVDSLPRGETGLSYCACWPNLSKAVLVAVMIYGRTRALPQQVDYALTLAIEIPSSDMSPPPSRLLQCAQREGFTRHNGVRIGRPSSCSSARAGSATATSATRRARAAPVALLAGRLARLGSAADWQHARPPPGRRATAQRREFGQRVYGRGWNARRPA